MDSTLLAAPAVPPPRTERRTRRETRPEARGAFGGPELSVVVPVAPGDDAWRDLLADLRPLHRDGAVAGTPAAEILLAGVGRAPADLPDDVRWIRCPRRGRAVQLNRGVDAAAGRTLWFLHADSRLSADAVGRTRDALCRGGGDRVCFLSLRYADDGPRAWGVRLCTLNAWGANVRSRVFGIPFGDQGLALPRTLFESLGRFDESAPYGEDHLLVWAAHRNGVPLVRIPAAVTTSARKYGTRGWLRVTATHLLLTVRQALPEAVRTLLARRPFRRGRR